MAYSDPSADFGADYSRDRAHDVMRGAEDVGPKTVWRAARAVVSLGIAGALGLSALSYSALDSTFDTAGSAGTLNVLGRPGAALANFSLQSLGCAVIILSLILAFSGLRAIFRPRPAGSKTERAGRIFSCAGAVIFGAILLSAAPHPQSWPLAVGLGGFVGDGLFSMVLGAFTAMHIPMPSVVIGVLAFLFASFCLGRYLGFVSRDAALFADAALTVWAHIRVYIDRMIAFIRRRVDKAYGQEVADGPAPLRAWLDEHPAEQLAAASAASAPPITETLSPIAPPSPPKAKRKSAARAAAAPKPGAYNKYNFPEDGSFVLPGLDLLKMPPARRAITDERQLQRNAERLAEVLTDFGVKGVIGEVRPGPVVTLYEFEPAPGVKSSRVINLAEDIARSMESISARVAVVPGRNAIGIELPNSRRETVYLRDMLASRAFKESTAGLPMAMGEDIGGQPFIADLSKMPHLLVAGTTGSGKSVGVNAMILSLMYTLTPDQCKFIMIDPKMLELSVYDGAPHLLAPVVTEPKKAVVALKWTVREMEDRYRKMAKMGVRNMAGYNEKVVAANASGEVMTHTVMTGYDKESGNPIYETEELHFEPMPFIVVVIDEMADLMMVAGKDIEGAVQRLAQMARAAGIHMIMATQRPSVDVITGTIKANFPTRVAFRVGSKIDSRTILGEQGGETLLGNGDMLFMGTGRPRRLHGPFVSDGEVEQIAGFVKAQGTPTYLADILIDKEEEAELAAMIDGTDEETSLFDKAVAIVASDRKASTSYIQRRLGIGYNRAANLIEDMERQGMIGPSGPGGKREIFLPEQGGY